MVQCTHYHAASLLVSPYSEYLDMTPVLFITFFLIFWFPLLFFLHLPCSLSFSFFFSTHRNIYISDNYQHPIAIWGQSRPNSLPILCKHLSVCLLGCGKKGRERLEQWFSKGDPWISQIKITGELVRSAEFQALHQTS